jgi:hypothetical protein
MKKIAPPAVGSGGYSKSSFLSFKFPVMFEHTFMFEKRWKKNRRRHRCRIMEIFFA